MAACRSEAEREGAGALGGSRLSAISGYPILAEFTSNMRGGAAIGAYESFLGSEAVGLEQAEVLIRFGAPPLSKTMQDFLAGADLRAHIHCSRSGEWADDSHTVTHHLVVDPASVSAAEWAGWSAKTPRTECSGRWTAAEHAARQVMEEEIAAGAYFDGAVLRDVVELMPAGGALFAGNSLPVRHLDQFGLSTERAPCSPMPTGARRASTATSRPRWASALSGRAKPLVAVAGRHHACIMI